eukprot:scaffold302256_cov17-Tisochrysis_lutea.AAC.1
MEPGAQLECLRQKHSEQCKQPQGAEITLPKILGCGWDYLLCPYPGSLGELGIDSQRSTNLHGSSMPIMGIEQFYTTCAKNSPHRDVQLKFKTLTINLELCAAKPTQIHVSFPLREGK